MALEDAQNLDGGEKCEPTQALRVAGSHTKSESSTPAAPPNLSPSADKHFMQQPPSPSLSRIPDCLLQPTSSLKSKPLSFTLVSTYTIAYLLVSVSQGPRSSCFHVSVRERHHGQADKIHGGEASSETLSLFVLVFSLIILTVEHTLRFDDGLPTCPGKSTLPSFGQFHAWGPGMSSLAVRGTLVDHLNLLPLGSQPRCLRLLSVIDYLCSCLSSTVVARAPFQACPNSSRTPLLCLSLLQAPISSSFNLDPKLAGDDNTNEPSPDFEAEGCTPFIGVFTDAFPGLLRSGESDTPVVPPAHPSGHFVYNSNRDLSFKICSRAKLS
ncbi:hypothetical protein K435DRAFT_867768 [Dendrothele bispora CBS 962.96]|uniref:Uncharacterized protein n=1 Tax=Dendrothele bispora (strain CBS 962.96) TaxID=1314807 RepID=A0A4S8LDD7_DENBC|nr:hypothetical protein K435DRAFT_867768 [Dendrothele bispora CBS 962.96]